MRKVLLFSGGYDSTCLLADLVSNSVNDGAEVICVTIQHNLTGVPKLDRESKAQEQIIAAVREQYPTVKISHEIIKIESNWNVGSTYESRGLSQSIFWTCNLIPLLNSEDVIYFGYILGDQAVTVKPYIEGMIQNACQIQDAKNVKVEFPYRWDSKERIMHRLLHTYGYLVEFCTSCEGLQETDTVCGSCEPCTHLKQAFVNIIVSNDYDKYEKKKARQMLKKMFNIRVRVEDLRCNKDDKSKMWKI